MAKDQYRVETTVSVNDKASGEIKTIKKEFDKLDKSAKQGAESFQKAGTGLNSFTGKLPMLAAVGAAVGIAVKAFQALKRAIDDVVDSAKKFETGMAKISTLMSGDINKQMAELSDTVLELGRNWKFTHEQFTDVAYDVVSSGLAQTNEQIKAVTEQTAALALAGQAELKPTFDLIAFSMKAFGIEAENTGYITQKLFNVVKQGKTTIAELSIPLSNVANIAASMGVDMDSLFASFAGASSFGRLAELSTEVKGFFVQLMNPNTELANALQALGINDLKRALQDVDGDFMKIIDQLVVYAEKEGVYLEELFNSVEAKNFVIKTQNEEFLESYKNYFASLGNETDNFIGAIDKMRTTTEHMGAQVNNVFEEIKVRFAAQFMPYLKAALQFILEVFKALGNIFNFTTEGSEKSKQSLQGFIDVLAFVAQMMNAFIATIRIGFHAVKAVITEVGAIVTGVVALVIKGIGGIVTAAEKAYNFAASVTPGMDKINISSGITEWGNTFWNSANDLEKQVVGEVDHIGKAWNDAQAAARGIENARKNALKESGDIFSSEDFARPGEFSAPDLISPEARSGGEATATGGASAKTSKSGAPAEPNLFLNSLLLQTSVIEEGNGILLQILNALLSGGGRVGGNEFERTGGLSL